MRLRKYYDFLRSNNVFFKASLEQKRKITSNVLKFLKSNVQRPLIVNHKPIIAQIEPTSECNLDCEMCVREKTGIPIGSMSFETFKKVLDKLNCLFKIHLSGQGESFMNPEIFKMIKYANNRGITVYFATNGTLLTPSVNKKLCEVEVGEIGVSIDSPKKEKFEKIRKNADFDKVKSNIRDLVNRIEKGRKKTIVSIGAILFKDNIDEIEDFVSLANEVGVKKIGFQTIQTKEDYVDKYGEDLKSNTIYELSGLKDKIIKAKKFARKKGVNLIFDEEKSPGCIWPWRSIYITWEGYVTPCCKILDYHRPYFGNILKDNFWDIWNGKEYQRFRELLRERKAPLSCRGCRMV